MKSNDFLSDKSFLREIDNCRNKTYYVKIIVLGKKSELYYYNQQFNNAVASGDADAAASLSKIIDNNNEIPIREIQGQVTSGSLSINGDSAIRRSGSLSFVAEYRNNQLENIEDLLTLNKKIKILIGIENTVNSKYDDILWFNQGIFVINQPQFTHSLDGVTVSFQFRDKMCLLDGSCGGSLPASVIFGAYDQLIGYEQIIYKNNSNKYPTNPNEYTVYGFLKEDATDINEIEYMSWNSIQGWYKDSFSTVGTTVEREQRIFDIIQTLVINYGGEAASKIIIEDVPLEIKNSVRYIGDNNLYGTSDGEGNYIFSLDESEMDKDEYETFQYNDDCGYVYTDFTYPGELTSSIGDTVVSILDKIKTILGNFEYFYDIEGNFIFREKKNYLNTMYNPIKTIYNTDALLDNDKYDYRVNFSNNEKVAYVFDKNTTLITSYSNTPNYDAVKNDFHIWGKNSDGQAIHYHLAIKEKPTILNNWKVIPEKDEDENYTGKIQLDDEVLYNAESKIVDSTMNLTGDSTKASIDGSSLLLKEDMVSVENNILTIRGDNVVYNYQTQDWREELYLQGLQKIKLGLRPDAYEQELIDLFDSVYNMWEHKFKDNLNTNNLTYYIDFLFNSELSNISVDSIGSRIVAIQDDSIVKMFIDDVPNVIFINGNSSLDAQAELSEKCKENGQPYSRVYNDIYGSLALGTSGLSAQDSMRTALYDYSGYADTISLTTIPIYYLDANTLIEVEDLTSKISGEYIINSINLPLNPQETMNISATKVNQRV